MPETIENGRVRLAHAVLVVARGDSRNPEQLKVEALEVMALTYKNDGMMS
jgi:hypothetical protein